MTDLLDLLVFHNVATWVILVITMLVIVAMPRFFGLNYLNGLLFSQITLFFNATTIISGLETEAVNIGRSLHFYLIEFSFLTLIFLIYRYFINHRERFLVAIQMLFNGKWAFVVTTFGMAMVIFNFLLAPTDGSSRIAYMTVAWFSLVKPFIQIVTPLLYIGVFVLLMSSHRRWLGYTLLVISIVANIATGSKASFAISLTTAFLALRDIYGHTRLVIRRKELLIISVLIGLAVIYALARLEVSSADILDRFFLSGEATILTYFSDTPTAACVNVSTFASMHRGWARLLGDASAQDIDTLFGYALTIEHLGVNTFTGPNGRLSAYFLCNFPDERVVLGAIVVLVYFYLMLLLFNRLIKRPTQLAFLFPFIFTSLAGAAQDFNLIMQDITIFVILFLTTLFFKPLRFRRQLG